MPRSPTKRIPRKIPAHLTEAQKPFRTRGEYLETQNQRTPYRTNHQWVEILDRDSQEKDALAEQAKTRSEKQSYLRQARVLSDISAFLSKWADKESYWTDQFQKNPESVGNKIDRLGQLVMRAARNGLNQHPFVENFILKQARLGNWDLLRKARMGLEQMAKKPTSPEELNCDVLILAMYKYGKSLEQIRRRLLVKFSKSLTKTGVSKRLQRLLKEWPWSLLVDTPKFIS